MQRNNCINCEMLNCLKEAMDLKSFIDLCKVSITSWLTQPGLRRISDDRWTVDL